MALSDNPFIGLPPEDIQAIITQSQQAIMDVLKTGKSNAFPGWSITRADLSELRTNMSLARIALANISGTGGKQVAQATINTARQFSGRSP